MNKFRYVIAEHIKGKDYVLLDTWKELYIEYKKLLNTQSKVSEQMQHESHCNINEYQRFGYTTNYHCNCIVSKVKEMEERLKNCE